MKRDYIPDAGDIVWMDFNPQAGHEQAGHRPALVLSPAVYNGRIGLLLCCPMTTKIKGYPLYGQAILYRTRRYDHRSSL